ncbi:MAG: hypothetical protein WCF22_12205 [Candidatus Sulfotelmatobacter sp.]
MAAKLKKKCKNCIVAKRMSGCLFGCTRSERVRRELDALMADSDGRKDPIEEQLRLCPEAFKAGELVGKLFDRLRHDDNEPRSGHVLPPAGVLIPPLV